MAQWVKNWHCLCHGVGLIPGPVQQVKDPALLQLWHKWKLRLRFNPQPRNFYMPWVQPQGRKKDKKRMQKKKKEKKCSCLGRD